MLIFSPSLDLLPVLHRCAKETLDKMVPGLFVSNQKTNSFMLMNTYRRHPLRQFVAYRSLLYANEIIIRVVWSSLAQSQHNFHGSHIGKTLLTSILCEDKNMLGGGYKFYMDI